jgi:uncharacterized membrane protein YhaH (DUF805 family)
MSFTDAIRKVLSNYATFSGRARRSELWWFVLFVFLGNAVLGLVDGALFGTAPDGSPVSLLGGIFSLAMLLPNLAVGARRLHDLDRTGWWLLIGLIPILGTLVLIFFFVQRGTDGPNRFGPDPLAGDTGT